MAWNIQHMVILGDSVPWGQGHRAENKYVFRLADALGLKNSDITMRAHSGAVIGAGYTLGTTAKDPEVPWATPTIYSQVEDSSLPADTTDLVIICGGINDVDFRTIINPLTQPDELHWRTWDSCYAPMQVLLKRAVNRFTNPKCRFLVQGYYPILSPASRFELPQVQMMFQELLTQRGLLGVDPSTHGAYSRTTQNCMQFWMDSNQALSDAVNDTNASLNLGNRIKFVASGFTESNALFADEQGLWGFDLRDIPGFLGPEDDVRADRAKQCKLQYPGFFDQLACQLCGYASVGHPNHRGVDIITQSLLAAI